MGAMATFPIIDSSSSPMAALAVNALLEDDGAVKKYRQTLKSQLGRACKSASRRFGQQLVRWRQFEIKVPALRNR